MSRPKRRHARPSVEAIEDRISPVGFFTQAEVTYWRALRDRQAAEQFFRAHPVPSPKPAPAVAGTITGTYALSSASLNANTTVTVNGSGTVSPLGFVTAKGQLTLLGRTQGTLTLTSPDGKSSVRLQLSAPTPRSLGTTFSATITSETGTGAFAAIKGSGTAAIHIALPASGATTGSFSVTFSHR